MIFSHFDVFVGSKKLNVVVGIEPTGTMSKPLTTNKLAVFKEKKRGF
jgi:hypothetical protein